MYQLKYRSIFETGDQNDASLLVSLPENVRQHILGKSSESARKQSLCAYSLLFDTLKLYGIYEIDFGAKGKPISKNSEIWFSLSHSGDLAVCAVADSPIGVDTERLRTMNPKPLLRRFSEKEQELLAIFPDRFLEFWTAHEAYGKLTGEGIWGSFSAPFSVCNDRIFL